jgi:hypothetical protein
VVKGNRSTSHTRADHPQPLAEDFRGPVGPCRGKLLSQERRRRGVMVLKDRYRASKRKVCRVVGQHRSTQRHPAKVVSIEKGKLRRRLRAIAVLPIRWGRRAWPTACCVGKAGW